MEQVKEIDIGDLVTVIGTVDSVVHDPRPNSIDIVAWAETDTENCILPAKFEGKMPSYRYRFLFKTPCEPTQCLYLGWTLKYLGHVYRTTTTFSIEYGREVEPGGIDIDERVLVCMVMPILKGNRYAKPIMCLPEHITEHIRR